MEEASSSGAVKTGRAPRSDADVRSAHVLCVANQKGGVGKTTTAVSLAAALAEAGLHVLLIDLDPQGNATTGLGLRVAQGEPSTYSVVVDGDPMSAAIARTPIDGLDLCPSSLDLAGAEIELVPAFSRELKLRQALEPVRSDHDLVIVDCPPTLGLLTVNALVAADEVLLPIQCEYYALEGVGQLVQSIELVQRSLNPALGVVGVVLTMFDGRTRLAEQVAAEVRSYFGPQVFRTVIPRSVRLSEAPGFGQPITVFDPTSRGALAYRRLARELGERLGLAAQPRSALDDLTDTRPEETA
ncbi:MAG: ParA family protein [Nitriliruptorales bacterium]